MEKDDLPIDLLLELGIDKFSERFPWYGGDLQTLRDTFISEKIDDQHVEDVLIDVPSIPGGNSGNGQLIAYLERPSRSSKIKGLVLILHGLGGSSRRQGLRRMASTLVQFGFAVLKLNLRGADPCRHMVPGSYAAECNSDLFPVFVKCREIAENLNDYYDGPKNNIPIYGVGISLGGTILLNACFGCNLSSFYSSYILDGLVCISSPLDLAESSASIERPRNFIYQKWLLNRLIKQTVEDPFGITGRELDLLKVDKKNKSFVNDIRSFDSAITAPRWGYKNVEDYYLKASPLDNLIEGRIDVRSILFVHSEDDPWVPSNAIEKLRLNIAKKRNLEKYDFVITRKGGHNGFHGNKGCWGDNLIKNWLLNI